MAESISINFDNLYKMEKFNDNTLKQILRKGAHEADENPWFTKRVINRLPQKQRKSGRWIIYSVCFLVIAGCALLWSDNFSDTTPIELLDGVSLPTNVIFSISLVAVTLLALQQIISIALNRQD